MATSIFDLDSSPPPSLPSTDMATTTSTIMNDLPRTPSRASRFTSVKDMLLLAESLSSSITKNPPSTKLKRPNKSAILARKSTNINSPSLLSKNGKITGKLTKSSSTTVSLPKSKTIESFDVFAIPSSPNPTPPDEKGLLLQTPPREEKQTKESYVPAKRIWTPIKENTRPEVIDLCTPDDVAKAAATGSFVSLLSSYKHNDLPSIGRSFDSINYDGPLKKGRCIGVVNIPGRRSSLTQPGGEQSKEESISKPTPKPKKTKPKKPKTITGLAVAPYLPADTEPTAPPPLPETSIEKPAEESKPKKPRKKRESTTTKIPKPKKTTTKKSAKIAHQPLLSPKSVQKRMDSQTFVFGTSSQLLRTDPPEEGWTLETTGRKLNTIQTHAKIHSKATWDLDTFSDTEDGITEQPKVQTECAVDTSGWGISDLDIMKGSRTKSKTGMGMWSKGSRGLLGELHSVEVMDLVDEDDLDDILSQRVSSQRSKTGAASSKAPAKEAVKEDAAPTLPEKLPTVHWTQLPTPASTNPDPKPSSSKTTKEGNTKADAPKLSDRPNFEAFTMVQLQTQINKYGFKPVKSRNTMVDILNRCWDSAEAMVANPPEPVELKPKAAAKGKGKKKASVGEEVEVPKKRGRKPKVATTEVEDEMDAPQPKRRKSSAAAAKAKKPDTSTLFKHIAAAIKRQPTSPDIKNPSWWQQILMNETIVVEEFAEWLVGSGFHAAGVDKSVWVDCGVLESSMDADSIEKQIDVVKMWCEARSVSFVERGSR
ncbi:5'-flap endonuclease [Arthrobotrys megalospora]